MATKKTNEVKLKRPAQQLVTVRLIGVSPLICHNWSEKGKRQMREKHQGRKTKTREPRDPEQEAVEATYWVDEKKTIPGFPTRAIKASIIEASHNDLGYPKTLLRKALSTYPWGRDVLVPIEPANGKPSGRAKPKLTVEVVEDVVRIAQGGTDLRYRPYFYDWALTTQWLIDADLLQVQDLLILLDRAGFGVGIGDWRPEKGGEYGRFRVDDKFKVLVKEV